MDYQTAVRTFETARTPSNGKPLQNNTRLFMNSDGSLAVVLHGTTVVQINKDDTFSLATGGWKTPTTLDRIRGFSPAKLFSDKGEWYVRTVPNPKDPRPERYERTIPKPFEAQDPGPEPVKSDEGCIAGSSTAEPYSEYEPVYDWEWRTPPPPQIYISNRYYPDGSGPRRMAHISGIERIFYGESSNRWGERDEWWGLMIGRVGHYEVRDRAEIDGKWVEYKQCPHCKAFDAIHQHWSNMMNGCGWGRTRFLGYKIQQEILAQFGTMDAWKDAYQTEGRARRAYLKADREWDDRNRVVFFDGITVNSDGYVPRLRASGPSPAKLRRHEVKVEKIKKKIDKYLDGYIAALTEGMPMPSSGDCWYCCMRTNVDSSGKRVEPGSGITWGDIGDTTHLLDHMRERYYVPSLAVNALRERGYKDVGIYMFLEMKPEEGTMGGERGRYDSVKRDIRNYLRRRLLPEAPSS